MVISSRKEREKEQRREEILDAAMRVFKRKGYQATSMEEVAKESEFSKGTLYSYFNSKYELFAELSNRVLSQVLQGFTEIAEEGISGSVMIGKMLRLWAQVATTNIKQFRLAMSWIASDERADKESSGADCHRECVGMIIGHLSAAIVRGKSDGSVVREGDDVKQACQLWSGMMGALLFSTRCEDLAEDFPLPVEIPLEPKKFMNDFVDLLTAGLANRS